MRRGLSNAIKKHSKNLHGKLLDVGCGTKPYKELFNVDSYIGLDIDSNHVREMGVADDMYDGNSFPYQSSEFDSVLCNQVLEHVFEPDLFLTEINRVMKSRGKLLLTIPFVWDEHEQPFDYARYSSFGLKALLEKNGFKILIHEKIGDDASILFQLTNAYLYKVTIKWNRYIRAIFAVLIMGGINLLGLLAKFISPKNADLFLDQIVIAEKL